MLTSELLPADTFFTSFEESATDCPRPEKFTFSFNDNPHPLGIRAAEMLQTHLENQRDWQHNFGLSGGSGQVVGKMFGVLVVETNTKEIGYLAAFSGKLAGANHHTRFVPPIFDGSTEGGFLNAGMEELSRINVQIRKLAETKDPGHQTQVLNLKSLRKKHSVALQNRIFDQYHFLNQTGGLRSLRKIFADADYKNPPAGAGECAAPKLFQYAFRHNMKPLVLAEFWWGLSPKSDFWKHRHFYPACLEKCGPILAYMLEGMEVEAMEQL